jgi:sodium-dependent dicarboxylate transporter 2/3/5
MWPYVGYMKDRVGYTINFVEWLLLLIPLTLLLLFLLYWLLVKILYPNNIKHSKETTIAIKTTQKD